MAVGIIATLFEIWETTLAVLLLLLISSGIIYVYSPDVIHAKTLATEISYIASIKGNKDYQIALDIEKEKEILIENSKNENTVSVYVSNSIRKKNYIGNNTEIKKQGNQILIS